jgi:hypothetical protein
MHVFVVTPVDGQLCVALGGVARLLCDSHFRAWFSILSCARATCDCVRAHTAHTHTQSAPLLSPACPTWPDVEARSDGAVNFLFVDGFGQLASVVTRIHARTCTPSPHAHSRTRRGRLVSHRLSLTRTHRCRWQERRRLVRAIRPSKWPQGQVVHVRVRDSASCPCHLRAVACACPQISSKSCANRCRVLGGPVWDTVLTRRTHASPVPRAAALSVRRCTTRLTSGMPERE